MPILTEWADVWRCTLNFVADWNGEPGGVPFDVRNRLNFDKLLDYLDPLRLGANPVENAGIAAVALLMGPEPTVAWNGVLRDAVKSALHLRLGADRMPEMVAAILHGWHGWPGPRGDDPDPAQPMGTGAIPPAAQQLFQETIRESVKVVFDHLRAFAAAGSKPEDPNWIPPFPLADDFRYGGGADDIDRCVAELYHTLIARKPGRVCACPTGVGVRARLAGTAARVAAQTRAASLNCEKRHRLDGWNPIPEILWDFIRCAVKGNPGETLFQTGAFASSMTAALFYGEIGLWHFNVAMRRCKCSLVEWQANRTRCIHCGEALSFDLGGKKQRARWAVNRGNVAYRPEQFHRCRGSACEEETGGGNFYPLKLEHCPLCHTARPVGRGANPTQLWVHHGPDDNLPVEVDQPIAGQDKSNVNDSSAQETILPAEAPPPYSVSVKLEFDERCEVAIKLGWPEWKLRLLELLCHAADSDSLQRSTARALFRGDDLLDPKASHDWPGILAAISRPSPSPVTPRTPSDLGAAWPEFVRGVLMLAPLAEAPPRLLHRLAAFPAWKVRLFLKLRDGKKIRPDLLSSGARHDWTKLFSLVRDHAGTEGGPATAEALEQQWPVLFNEFLAMDAMDGGR